ncbi:MAG: hypothetical protein Q9174_005757 [Haloplaca sp. 1 TL-2023]
MFTGRFRPEDEFGPDVDLHAHLRQCTNPSCMQYHTFINLPCQADVSKGHVNEIVVSVDGACRNNGSASAISSYGVYFGDESPHNITATVDTPVHTSQRAELHACAAALEKVLDLQRMRNSGLDVEGYRSDIKHLIQVIIKADSAYLVNGMTEFLAKWKENGYKNAKGLPVANADLFKDIDMVIDDLRDLEIAVAFWLVPRRYNREADILANEALDAVMNVEPGVE